jgi:HEAT repeat protein
MGIHSPQLRSDILSSKEVQQFEQEALNHGKFLEKGDSKSANKAYNKIHNSYLLLRGRDAISELEELLNGDSPYVRLWAARYLLQVATNRAEEVLVELGKLKDISVGFDARMTLSEWKEGNLLF